MSSEDSKNHVRELFAVPQMSNYLYKAMIRGDEERKLWVMSVSNHISKAGGGKPFIRVTLLLCLDGVRLECALTILNADSLSLGDADNGAIFSHGYGRPAGGDLRDHWTPMGADRWVANYEPQADPHAERSLCFLMERPSEFSYMVANMLLELAELRVRDNLSLVYLDGIGLRHVLCLRNENDDDPELTYAVIHLPGKDNFRRPYDYRHPLRYPEQPKLLEMMLRELELGDTGDRDDPHPLDTNEEKVTWAYAGPYGIQYAPHQMLIYTDEGDGVLPVEPMIIITQRALAQASIGGMPGWILRTSDDIRNALEKVSALYQPHPASELARDFLAMLMKLNSFEPVSMSVRLDGFQHPAYVTLIQGDVAIDFNLQY